MNPARPVLTELAVADPLEAWRAAGFTVQDDGVTRVGAVHLRLVGREHGKHLLGWAWRGLPGEGLLDGIATSTSTVTLTGTPASEPETHPNGVTLLDHVVVTTPDLDRTIAAFTARGLEVRRVRHTDQYGPPFRQVFFRGGEAILEVIGPATPTDATPTDATPRGATPRGDDPARLYGLAFTVADLDATAALLGDGLGRVKDAVQPGRRIATLRHRELGISVPIALMSA